MSRGKVVGKVVVRVGWVGKGGWLVDRSVGWLIGWLRRWLGWGVLVMSTCLCYATLFTDAKFLYSIVIDERLAW